MRPHLIAANWKMHKNPMGTTCFFENFLPAIEPSGNCEIVICPPLLDVKNAVTAADGTRVRIGAQNLYWQKEGAFTGEVSGDMIKASGCSHVIVGHSERRYYFGETNQTVLKKAVAALEAGLTPILCVGERDRKNVEVKLTEQFRGGVAGLSDEQFADIVIGYEPLWAIGEGTTATPQVAAAAHRFLRALAQTRFGAEAANKLRIIYGGSVKADNAQNLSEQPEIDGFLVGGASLDPVAFAALVNLRGWN
ncbi:MAG: triose-phosphate isomerase [Terriglobia bacterium]